MRYEITEEQAKQILITHGIDFNFTHYNFKAYAIIINKLDDCLDISLVGDNNLIRQWVDLYLRLDEFLSLNGVAR